MDRHLAVGGMVVVVDTPLVAAGGNRPAVGTVPAVVGNQPVVDKRPLVVDKKVEVRVRLQINKDINIL